MHYFSVYADETKITSGQRFFLQLARALGRDSRYREGGPGARLFNISAPWREIVKCRVAGRRVVLRVDGVYFDRLSDEFIQRFSWPMRAIFRLGATFRPLQSPLAHVANLIDRNWTSFARIALAHHIVYQSNYSRQAYLPYFPKKPFTIIVNGSRYLPDAARLPPPDPTIRIATIFDDWRPAKRMADLIQFVRWANEIAATPVSLTLLGYTGRFPPCAPQGLAELVASRPYFRTFPRFSGFDSGAGQALAGSDLYATLSFRDACPNVVVEAMAHGLPVLGVASGGLPDIVGDAGVLLPSWDNNGHFASGRFECDFPQINFEAALNAAQYIKTNARDFRERVRRRFDTTLSMEVVATRYLEALCG